MNESTALRIERIVILAGVVFPSLLTWLYFVALQEQPRGLQQAVYAVGKSMQFALPLVLLFLLKRSAWPSDPAGDGLSTTTARSRCRGIVEGLAFGAIVFVLMVAGYHCHLELVIAGHHYWIAPAVSLAPAAEAIRTKVAAFGVDSPAKFIVLGLFYSVIHSFLEEYYWRWFVFGRLRDWLAPGAAICLSSIAFAAHHVIVLAHYFGWTAWPTWLFALAVAVGGAVWAWTYHRSRSLLGPWLSHLLIDAAIFTIGYRLVCG
jgi:membrane protease YdiL (CAAX protease family)